MTLFERFGWVTKVDRYLSSLEDSRSQPGSEFAVPSKKSDIATSANNVSICYYLQGDLAQAAKYARETIDAVLELYYGTWSAQVPTDLGTHDAQWWRLHMMWTPHFREGLCWASSLGDWASVVKIAQYPVEQIDLDPSYTKEDRAVFLALAYYLKGEKQSSYQHHFEQIAKGRKEKPKLVAEVLRALQMKSPSRFQQTLEAYLGYFGKREFKKKELDNLLCLDGTTLLNIGRREGLVFQMPREVEDHIIRLSQGEYPAECVG